MNHMKSATVLLTLLCSLPTFAADIKTLPNDITLAQAQNVLQVAMSQAETIKVPMNITVMDAGGNLKAFACMDDALEIEKHFIL